MGYHDRLRQRYEKQARKQQNWVKEKKKKSSSRKKRKPKNSKHDKTIIRGKQLYNRAIDQLQRKRYKSLMNQKILAEKEMENCTFQPRTISQHIDFGETMLIRNQKWYKNLNNKIKKQKYEKDAAELQNCTFQPNS